MDRHRAPCRDCRTLVPAAVTTCPACGYDVDRHERWRLLFGLVGTLLTVSLAFAPVGLPMLWLAHRHQLAAAGSVTEPRVVTIRDRVTTVLAEHAGLGRPTPACRGAGGTHPNPNVFHEPR